METVINILAVIGLLTVLSASILVFGVARALFIEYKHKLQRYATDSTTDNI